MMKAHALAASFLTSAALLAGGCQLLGVAASKAPPRTVPAAYEDLAGHTTAVWVWVDPAADLDYPRLSLEIASRVQRNLEAARDGGSRRQRRELEGVSFPIEPESIVKHQKSTPMLNMMPITEIAPRLDVERLVYIELMSFTTRGGAAAGLLRGDAQVNISVIEIENGTAREAYREQGVRLVFPPGGPEEGSSTIPETLIYQGIAAAIADAATMRLVSHPEQERR